MHEKISTMADSREVNFSYEEEKLSPEEKIQKLEERLREKDEKNIELKEKLEKSEEENKVIKEKLEKSEEENKVIKEKFEKSEAENKNKDEKNKTKDKFFRVLAHDLRNPIGNAYSITDMFLDDAKDGVLKPEEFISTLGAVSKNFKEIYELLNNLLDWSYKQQDGLSPEFSTINLDDVMQQPVDLSVVAAKLKEIKIINEIPKNSEIYADPSMLRIVLLNLLTNAVKYTYKGGEIKISSQKNDKFFEIQIKDNGVGLTETQVKNLLITTGESIKGTEQEKGNGFGLSICKEFVEKMNGHIRVESEGEGRGTTFIVTLPTAEKTS